MRTLGIISAAIVGLAFGSFIATALTLNASVDVVTVASGLGGIAGAVGLGVLVARLIPAREPRRQ